jgi:hypothetical protein
MKKLLPLLAALFLAPCLHAQLEPSAGSWKTWFISSGKSYKLPAPLPNKNEVQEVLSRQQAIDSAAWQQIQYWNAGAPGYHWYDMMNKLWQMDTSYNGALANLLLGTAIYDATIVVWNCKYSYNRPRPFVVDKRIKALIPGPGSPSYPCEYSVAAGVAVTVISHFFPSLTDSVNKMARQLMDSRIAAGVAYKSDTKQAFELGKTIAEKEIELTKNYLTKERWDGKFPDKQGIWKGKFALMPTIGLSKTVVLTSASQFRPAPPPDFSKDMAELNSYKQTFRSSEALNRKIFENNLHLDPPKAARIYAAKAIASYDAVLACFDAKYAYWGIRPDQYDTSYHSLVPTPPFPGYPSGHAVMSGAFSELYTYFFPADANYFRKKAKDAAESRFQAGIHFRTDNEVGLDLGRKIGGAVIDKLRNDGIGQGLLLASRNN